jgi:hypothetical protein
VLRYEASFMKFQESSMLLSITNIQFLSYNNTMCKAEVKMLLVVCISTKQAFTAVTDNTMHFSVYLANYGLFIPSHIFQIYNYIHDTVHMFLLQKH